MPHNRTFRRLLLLPPTHPNVSRYIGSSDGGLGLPRLSNQSNLRNRKWSILCRLQKRGGLPAFAIGELLSLAAAVSDGQFLSPHQGAILAHPPSHQSGAAASARWARTQRSTSPPAWGRSPILFAAPSPPPPPRQSGSFPRPPSSGPQYLGRSHHAESRQYQVLASPPPPNTGTVLPLLRPSASPLARRPSSDVVSAILVTLPRTG